MQKSGSEHSQRVLEICGGKKIVTLRVQDGGGLIYVTKYK